MQVNLFLSLTGTTLASSFLLGATYLSAPDSLGLSLFYSMYITAATSNRMFKSVSWFPLIATNSLKKSLAGKTFIWRGGSAINPSLELVPTESDASAILWLSLTSCRRLLYLRFCPRIFISLYYIYRDQPREKAAAFSSLRHWVALSPWLGFETRKRVYYLFIVELR